MRFIGNKESIVDQIDSFIEKKVNPMKLFVPDVNTSDFSCCLEWNDIINKNLSSDIFTLQAQQENNQKIIKSLDDSNDKEEIGRLEKQTHIISSLLHKISNCLCYAIYPRYFGVQE